jgi:hypothetical protein
VTDVTPEQPAPTVAPGRVFVVRQVIEFQHHGVFIRDVVSFTQQEFAVEFVKEMNEKTAMFLTAMSGTRDGTIIGHNAQIVGSLFAMSQVLYQVAELEVRASSLVKVVKSPIILARN